MLPVERARGPIAEDLALLRAFVGGDDAAFEELARRHGRLVPGLVRRYARDREEARDLAQQVFLRAVQATERASSRGELHVRGWLAQIALNLAKNARRDSVRRTEAYLAHALEPPPPQAMVADADAALGQAARERQVKMAVLRLPRRQREVLTLRIDGGLTFQEVAEALGIAEGNARVQFHKAVRPDTRASFARWSRA